MAEHNVYVNYGKLPKIGKATMYVISEDGLQMGPFIYNKTTDSRVRTDQNVYFGGKQRISRTKSNALLLNERCQSKLRVLDLNGLVDFQLGRSKCIDKRGFACVTSENDPFKHSVQCSEAKLACKHSVFNVEYVSCYGKYRRAFDQHKNNDSIEGKESLPGSEVDRTQQGNTYVDNWFTEKQNLPYSKELESSVLPKSMPLLTEKGSVSLACSSIAKDCLQSLTSANIAEKGDNKDTGNHCLKDIFYAKGSSLLTFGNSNSKRLPRLENRKKATVVKPTRERSLDKENCPEEGGFKREKTSGDLVPLRINFPKNKERRKKIFQSIVKLPTVVNYETGQVHLTLKEVSLEHSDYNKWSRKEKPIRKGANFAFPSITKSTL